MANRRNHRGFGHVRKLPSGRWQASYQGPDLARHNAPSTFDAKVDAEGWLTAERRMIAADTWIAPARRQAAASATPSTLAEYAEAWLAVRDLRPRTRRHYRSLLDLRIVPALGDLEVSSITPAVVRAWYADNATGTRHANQATPTARAHAYGLLRTILGTAVEDGLLPGNPCHLRGAGNAKRVRQVKPATLAELGTLVENMPEKHQLAALLAAWCALRFGELTELRRKDVDLTAGALRIRRAVAWVDGKAVIGKPKTDAGVRDVAIPPHLLPAIKAHLVSHTAWGRDGLLFPSATGGHLTPSGLYHGFYPAREAAGRPDLRWHDLRHTGAVLAAQTGATLAELMGRLGHSTPAAAMRYQHAAHDRDRQIAAALSKMAAGES